MFFLETEKFLEQGGTWILDQVGIVVVVVLVLLAIKAWINKEYMTVFTSILIGAIIMVFALADKDTLESLGKLFLGIFGLDDNIK